MSDNRRHPRVQYAGLIFISWMTLDGQRNHALGKCFDVSERGLGLEVSTRIPVGSFVKVMAYGLNLNGSAIVRRFARRPGGYVLGLELSAPLDADLLANLCGSQTDVVAAIAG